MYIFCCCFGAVLLASSSSALTRSVSLGQSVTLLCEGAANGPIEWRFKQQQQDQWQSVVALHDGGVSPGPGFEERVKFVRTENPWIYNITLGPVVFTDGGVYQCKALHTDRIFSDVRLEVLDPFQVFVQLGQSVSLPCHGNIHKQIRSDELHFQWQKDGQDVYKHQNSKTTSGPGFENRVSVSLDRAPHGDLSLTIKEARLSDQGDYRCVYNIEKENGQPPLVHLNVTGLGVSSAQNVVLNGVLGQSVAFPDAVKKSGTLTYQGDSPQTIGDVTRGQFTDYTEGRVQWNSTTGLFSISGLKVEDSGMYTLLNNDAEPSKENQYQLNVDVSVSPPRVNVTRDTYRCTILCTVERGAAVTLTWYREGEAQSYASSPSRNTPDAYLPLTVDEGGTYTCEAKNSVNRETAKLTVGPHCTGEPNAPHSHLSHTFYTSAHLLSPPATSVNGETGLG
ncbi:hypothetical protein AAFF_G00367880 [Aldrovandia affinis]|uniref:Ig-like domain-containing protein n=1 Tax=Aldrovandia affinis TaxID=143900 RepID=A0AAD7R720_9TELE|nr:hypothetical protein AAFF_G00367880 [Aldrovandia affinis]